MLNEGQPKLDLRKTSDSSGPNPAEIKPSFLAGSTSVDVVTDEKDVLASWFGSGSSGILRKSSKLANQPMDTPEHHDAMSEYVADLTYYSLNKNKKIHPDEGLIDSKGRSVRPFGLEQLDGKTVMLALDENDEQLTVPLSDLDGITVQQDNGEDAPIISFLYYKEQKDANGNGTGSGETRERVIQLTGIGHGVHNDHQGEAPTFYFTGKHLGDRSEDKTTYSRLPPEKVTQKHFSLARLVKGFGGDPTRDPEHLRKYKLPLLKY